MYRTIEAMNAEGKLEVKIYGVLTDYDNSSHTKDLLDDCAKEPVKFFGTPLYTAHEVLMRNSPICLYRHDVESFFYIVLFMCGRYTFGSVKIQGAEKETKIRHVVRRSGALPYEEWLYEQNYNVLGLHKHSFLRNFKDLELSPCFEDFRPWLEVLQSQFAEGFLSKSIHRGNQLRQQWGGGGELAPFDDETLGGHISYSSLIEPVRQLKGGLEGLIIRYNPPPSPLSVSAYAPHANP